jgi:hypothetical protein
MALIGALIERLANVTDREDDWRTQAAWGLAIAASGAVLWLWHWTAARRRLDRAPEVERASTTRRAYLLAVLGSTLIALIVGLSMTVYRLLQELLGVEDTDELAADISLPLGIALVATAGAIYHGVLLRRDLSVSAAVAPAATTRPARLRAVITGPTDADLLAVLAELQAHLPEGYEITAHNGGAPRPKAQSALPNRAIDHAM